MSQNQHFSQNTFSEKFQGTCRKRILISLSLFSIFFLAGCRSDISENSREETSDKLVSVKIAINSLNQSKARSYTGTHADVDTIKATVKNGDSILIQNQILTFDQTSDSWQGSLSSLPSDTSLTFIAEAYQSSTGDPTGDSSTKIFSGQTQKSLTTSGDNILINMAPVDDGQALLLPRIPYIQKPASVTVSTQNNITIQVEGSTGEKLSYEITPASNGGSFDSVSGEITLSGTTADLVITHTAPAIEGDYLHLVKVINSQGNSITNQFKVTVTDIPQVNDGLITQFSPVILNLHATPIGSTVAWEADVTDDAPLNQLSYQWSFSALSSYFDDANSNPAEMTGYSTEVSGTLQFTATDASGASTTVEYSVAKNQFPALTSSIGVTQVTSGYYHTCAQLTDGNAKCWGWSTTGQTGGTSAGDDPGSMGDSLSSVDLGIDLLSKEIKAGERFTCALLDNNQVKCWGDNGYGQLGLGDQVDRGRYSNEMGVYLPNVNLGTGRTAKSLAVGTSHVCAILDDDSVKCWGYNGSGQLGLGDLENRGDTGNEMGDSLPTVDLGSNRTALTITAGPSHTCAILDDNSVKCWGYNGYGRLGLGDTNSRGDQSSDMGDSLPTVDLGTNKTAKILEAGKSQTCAILNDDSLKCWGGNSYGSLGYETTDTRGDQSSDMGDNLPAINLGTGRTASAITTSNDHSCAIMDNGMVKCWGYNNRGQLGLGDVNNRGGQANHMGDNLSTVDLGTGRTALSITAGYDITCAVLDNNQMKCWGYNGVGQLGLEDEQNRGDNSGEMGDYLPYVNLGS